MRRTTAILAVCFCGLTGCRGGEAQEPYDGVMTTSRPAGAVAPAPQEVEAEPIASEVDVPWAIALLSDAAAPRSAKPVKALLADAGSGVSEPVAPDADDLRVAVEPEPSGEKQVTPKACSSGVVKSRS